MTASRKNDVIVGVFVLIALAVLFAMTYTIQGSTGRNPYLLTAVFDDVAGLEIGSPVLVSGFRVGRVVKMNAEEGPDGRNRVVVIARVARDIPIYKDAEVRLAQQGFIGDKRLEIKPGSREAGEITEEDILNSVSTTGLGQFVDGADEMVENFQKILANIARITSDQERLDNIDATIVNIKNSTEQLEALLRENREAVAATSDNVREITTQFVGASERADEISATLQRTLEEINGAVVEIRRDREVLVAKLESLLDNADATSSNVNELVLTANDEIQALSSRLQKATDELNGILVKVNRGEGTVGRLVNDPKPFDDLQASINSLRAAFFDEGNTLYERDLSIRRSPATSSQ